MRTFISAVLAVTAAQVSAQAQLPLVNWCTGINPNTAPFGSEFDYSGCRGNGLVSCALDCLNSTATIRNGGLVCKQNGALGYSLQPVLGTPSCSALPPTPPQTCDIDCGPNGVCETVGGVSMCYCANPMFGPSCLGNATQVAEDLNACQQAVADVSSQLATCQANITTLEGQVTAAQAQLTTCEANATQLATALDTCLANNTAQAGFAESATALLDQVLQVSLNTVTGCTIMTTLNTNATVLGLNFTGCATDVSAISATTVGDAPLTYYLYTMPADGIACIPDCLFGDGTTAPALQAVATPSPTCVTASGVTTPQLTYISFDCVSP